ncbi:hypothetical protein QU487_06135 [Crenobacter sp. SG2305]|uniref:hypothetical protein n=1 Tax=Crenobacter oryzisoli TaxID=3056844 RepID=UPI0025AB5051|nr:hypothetical protein [Crenobacter sp. SG2305]MDN0082330.1 hypothetical protein [Crenobacter sp. SG2305]
MSKSLPIKCRITNWNTNNAVLKRRGSLIIWLGKVLPWRDNRHDIQARSETLRTTLSRPYHLEIWNGHHRRSLVKTEVSPLAHPLAGFFVPSAPNGHAIHLSAQRLPAVVVKRAGQ